MQHTNQANGNAKDEDLESYRKDAGDQLTTDTGVIIDDTDNSLKVGSRGSTLHEDFQFQEKLSAFDRERIPERVVHARGSGAHGYFQPCEAMAEFTGVSLDAARQDEQGVIAARKADASQIAKLFAQAIAQHRYWKRFEKAKGPA